MDKPNTTGPKKHRPFLRRFSRFSAYALLAGVVVLILSGWGITQTGVIYNLTFGLVDRRAANAIHRIVTTPIIFFFLVHVLINIRFTLRRKIPIRPWILDGILVLLGVCLMGIALYMEYFRLGG